MPLPQELPDSERPRERLLRHGPCVLTDAELLAVMVRTGVAGRGAVELGRLLIERFGGLRALFAAGAADLRAVPGLGDAKICQLLAVLELARRALEETLTRECALDHPQRVKQYCTALIGHRTVEHCVALYLDSQYRLIATEEVARGTLTQASIYPREVIKAGLKHHAAALILAHNHPSGVSEPSEADLALTRHLKHALALVDIRLLDHLIVTATGAISLAERGQI